MQNLFLITKPNQLFISLSILNQIQRTSSDLLIIDNFQSSNHLKSILFKEKIWNNVYFKKSKIKIIQYFIRGAYSNFYTDSDVGFLNFLIFCMIKILNPKIKIFVYEEGVGTYSNERLFYDHFKIWVFRQIGIGTNFGNCKFTSGIYLFNVEKYQNFHPTSTVSLHEIKSDLFSIYTKYNDLIDKIYSIKELHVLIQKHRKKKCTVILGTYYYSENQYYPTYQSLIKAINDCAVNEEEHLVLIKNHPHKVNMISIDNMNYAVNVSSSIPAEILIWILYNYYDVINVIHSGSSVLLYISNYSFIEYDYDVCTSESLAEKPIGY